MHFPPIFHRIWLGPKNLPTDFAAYGETWGTRHPGWQMQLWTDANLPPLANQVLFDRAPSFAAKADILRYELLLQFGGVYVDTDFECLKNIESFLEGTECFVAQQKDLDADFGKFCYVNNALMGAVPGHPLFRDLVESLPNHIASLPPDAPAAALTGPHYLTTVLQSHPGVKIFPAKFFYPYTATERWRRHEKFPEAFAVHHWTLSDVAVNRLNPRRLGSSGAPCLSVCLRPVAHDDGTRLRWVLEGLCLQTVTNFEVLVPAEISPELRTMLTSFDGRLTIRLLPVAGADGGSMGVFAVALGTAQAPRVLFLDTDCLPDIDVVETHARSGAKSELLFGYRRIYPVEKLFPFREAVDYGGLFQHCRPERTGLYIVPSAERWKDVEPSCFSVPATLVRRMADIPRDSREAVHSWAERLTKNGCPSAPCIYGARVTQLGVQTDSSYGFGGEAASAALVPFRLNERIATLRRRSTAAGRGADGRSPYTLQRANLGGARSQEISSLQFHLLEAFQRPAPLDVTINALVERVAVEVEKRARVLSLCRSYVEDYVADGILVPSRRSPEPSCEHRAAQ
jgi:hypothetical protein